LRGTDCRRQPDQHRRRPVEPDHAVGRGQCRRAGRHLGGNERAGRTAAAVDGLLPARQRLACGGIAQQQAWPAPDRNAWQQHRGQRAAASQQRAPDQRGGDHRRCERRIAVRQLL
ncbi:hypothetical protein XPN_4065, partial [Xanthomonas arboricola pv. pruni MAFF 301427]